MEIMNELIDRNISSLSTEPILSEKCINICSWNIQGLTQDKLDVLLVYFKQYDLIFMQECWVSSDDPFYMENYIFKSFPRVHKNINAKRNSGGLCVFIRKSISKGVQLGKHNNDIVSWLTLKQSFFGFRKDIKIANIYVVPEGSIYHDNDIFGMIENDIDEIDMNVNDCVLLGDFNSHTNVVVDYVIEPPGKKCEHDEELLFDDINNGYINELHEKGCLQRYSLDRSPIDNHGRDLINLCRSRSLIIMNGRIGKDKKIGSYTRMCNSNTNSGSVIDYALSNCRLYNDVNTFNIGPKLPESDHLPISSTV